MTWESQDEIDFSSSSRFCSEFHHSTRKGNSTDQGKNGKHDQGCSLTLSVKTGEMLLLSETEIVPQESGGPSYACTFPMQTSSEVSNPSTSSGTSDTLDLAYFYLTDLGPGRR